MRASASENPRNVKMLRHFALLNSTHLSLSAMPTSQKSNQQPKHRTKSPTLIISFFQIYYIQIHFIFRKKKIYHYFSFIAKLANACRPIDFVAVSYNVFLI